MLADSKTGQLPFAAAAADSNAASAAILSEFSTGQRRTTSNLTSNGSKIRCFAIKLGAKGAATCSRILDTVNQYMPNCQKKKAINKKDKCEKNDSESAKGPLPFQQLPEAEIPKLMPSRFFNFQRPGCSSDEFAAKGAHIYLPDGDDGVSTRNAPPLFPIDDCLPPPNYYPFEAGASFTCLSNCFEGHESFKMLITGKGVRSGCWPAKGPSCSDESSHAATRQRIDCRKLENGCFSSHSRWSPRMQKEAQQNPQPNLVVYVPRRNGNFAKNCAPMSPSVSEKSCETVQTQIDEGSSDVGWLDESHQELPRKHSFSSVSTTIVDELTHSSMLSLEFSDSQD